mgnify:CR=1 FL=1
MKSSRLPLLFLLLVVLLLCAGSTIYASQGPVNVFIVPHRYAVHRFFHKILITFIHLLTYLLVHSLVNLLTLPFLAFLFFSHSHCDVGWLKTIDEYYYETVKTILDNTVEALMKDRARKFIWVETYVCALLFTQQMVLTFSHSHNSKRIMFTLTHFQTN